MNAKPRWLRFSLRTLLLITLVAGVAFGLISREARNRQAALRMVREYGGRIDFDSSNGRLAWHEKLRNQLFGAETFQPVQNVNMLTNGTITPNPKVLPTDFLARLSALSEIGDLGLENTVIDPEDWHNIANFPGLKYVLLGRSNITDDDVSFLSGLPNLDTVSMSDARKITDKALPAFSRMNKLTNLKLDDTKLTDDGLQELFLPQLEILELQGVKLTSRSAAALKRMSGLRVLLLDWTNIDDAALEPLGELPSLEHLQLQATKVTRDGVARFREAHPTCAVTGP
jgi:hypothetical protein